MVAPRPRPPRTLDLSTPDTECSSTLEAPAAELPARVSTGRPPDQGLSSQRTLAVSTAQGTVSPATATCRLRFRDPIAGQFGGRFPNDSTATRRAFPCPPARPALGQRRFRTGSRDEERAPSRCARGRTEHVRRERSMDTAAHFRGCPRLESEPCPFGVVSTRRARRFRSHQEAASALHASPSRGPTP